MDVPNFDLRAKVEWLSRPEAYPDRPLAVEALETHFAWVFLAGRFAYKLKKPLRFHDFDLTTLATRRANCELEVALNRRLAPTIYLGTVPLCASAPHLSLGGPGTPVEWLVKMVRLPRERALDRLAQAREIEDTHVHALMSLLGRFYARTTRAPWDGRAYRRALTASIAHTADDLEGLAVDGAETRALAADLTAFVSRRADLLHGRIAAGRVVDAHGDLRPEHVFLVQPEPQVIDCLEFSAELRLLDSAAEIAFLALECDRLGQAALAARVLALYREHCADDVTPELLAFYRAERAFIRAKLAAWHLHEALPEAVATHWRAQTRWYLDAATSALARSSR